MLDDPCEVCQLFGQILASWCLVTPLRGNVPIALAPSTGIVVALGGSWFVLRSVFGFGSGFGVSRTS